MSQIRLTSRPGSRRPLFVKDTDSLGGGDLMNAVRVLQRAENFIAEQA